MQPKAVLLKALAGVFAAEVLDRVDQINIAAGDLKALLKSRERVKRPRQQGVFS